MSDGWLLFASLAAVGGTLCLLALAERKPKPTKSEIDWIQFVPIILRVAPMLIEALSKPASKTKLQPEPELWITPLERDVTPPKTHIFLAERKHE